MAKPSPIPDPAPLGPWKLVDGAPARLYCGQLEWPGLQRVDSFRPGLNGPITYVLSGHLAGGIGWKLTMAADQLEIVKKP